MEICGTLGVGSVHGNTCKTLCNWVIVRDSSPGWVLVECSCFLYVNSDGEFEGYGNTRPKSAGSSVWHAKLDGIVKACTLPFPSHKTPQAEYFLLNIITLA